VAARRIEKQKKKKSCTSPPAGIDRFCRKKKAKIISGDKEKRKGSRASIELKKKVSLI